MQHIWCHENCSSFTGGCWFSKNNGNEPRPRLYIKQSFVAYCRKVTEFLLSEFRKWCGNRICFEWAFNLFILLWSAHENMPREALHQATYRTRNLLLAWICEHDVIFSSDRSSYQLQLVKSSHSIVCAKIRSICSISIDVLCFSISSFSLNYQLNYTYRIASVVSIV